MYGGGGKQTPQLFRVLCPPKKWCARGLSLSPNFHPALCAALEIGAGLGHWAEMGPSGGCRGRWVWSQDFSTWDYLTTVLLTVPQISWETPGASSYRMETVAGRWGEAMSWGTQGWEH